MTEAGQQPPSPRTHRHSLSSVISPKVQSQLSLMGWVFESVEHTPLFVVTFLILVYLGLWASLAVWGPDTARVTSLMAALEKAFTFFLGLFSGIGISIGTRRR